jgi:hypothetical protein
MRVTVLFLKLSSLYVYEAYGRLNSIYFLGSIIEGNTYIYATVNEAHRILSV